MVELQELGQSPDKELMAAILGVLALSKGLRTYARFLLAYPEAELPDLEASLSQSQGDDRA